jgi:RNA polymerase sigma factor (sigma-70 family)
MTTDADLLRRYASENSEAAFAELVQRHLSLVYFAALRQVGGDAHRAKDVAQTVFTDLARKAAALTGRDTLTGWLHTSTRFAATKARRADFTRQHHEQEASTMNALLSDANSAAEWERLRPMIDEVIHELDERDREAVLLRYFENRPFAEIGATLHVSEDAARMRVDRALEKLRTLLARRGVKSTGAALAAAFANQVTAAAPTELAASITGTALAGAGAASAGAGLFMSNTSTAIVGAVTLAAIGATFFQWNHAQRAEAELAALRLDRDSLRAQFAAEQQRATRLAQDTAAQRSEIESLKAKQAELLAAQRPAAASTNRVAPTMSVGWQQQTMLNQLRQIAAARDQFALEHSRLPASLDELVGEKKYIRRIDPVDGESYTTLPLIKGQPMVLTTTNGITVTYDESGTNTTRPAFTPEEARVFERQQQMEAAWNKADGAYRVANNGKAPPSIEALVPYFATPQEGADFVEFLEAQKTARGGK